MVNKQYVYIFRIVDGQKTQERYSIEAAIKAYDDVELVARFLERQRHRVSANIIAAAKRDAAVEQDAQDEELSGAVDQNIRRQSGSRRFGDLIKKDKAKEEKSQPCSGNIKEVGASSKTGLIRYLNKIGQFPRLERQEEYELAKSWREHSDFAARDKLITSHLRLVVSIADDNRGYRRSKESLISEGTVGLIEAVDLFDPEKGFRLSTYVRSRIKGQILNFAMCSSSLVKIGTTDDQKKLFFRLQEEKSRIGVLHDGDLEGGEVKLIAERQGVKEEEVVEINRRRTGDVSLNMLIKDENGNFCELGDLLADGDHIEAPQESRYIEAEEAENCRKALDQKLGLLNDRERRIVEARWLADKLVILETLAVELDISRERVRQIEKRAFEKMGLSHLLVQTPAKRQKRQKVVYAAREHEGRAVKDPGRAYTLAERAAFEQQMLAEIEQQKLRGRATNAFDVKRDVLRNAFHNATPSELAAIKARRAEQAAVRADLRRTQEGIEQPKLSFVVGAEAYVLSGPFATLKGIIEEVDEARSQVKVAMSIFGRATPIELKFGQVKMCELINSVERHEAWEAAARTKTKEKEVS